MDPGSQGAVAVMWEDGKISLHKSGSPVELSQICEDAFMQASPDVRVCAFLELVGGNVGKQQPGGAMFKFGASYGLMKGLALAHKASLHEVRPQAWQKGLPCERKLKGPERKRRLRDIAKERYPKLGAVVTLDTCDALLIAEYGRREIQGGAK